MAALERIPSALEAPPAEPAEGPPPASEESDGGAARATRPSLTAPLLVAQDVWRIDVDDKALHYLAALRDQVSPGAEQTGGDALNVYTGVTAIEHGIEPGSDEHDALLNELVGGGYLAPHPRTIFRNQRVYRITLKGIAAVDRV